MKIPTLASVLVVILAGCSKSAFVPVNVGREYGNPSMPLFISHLAEKHRGMLMKGNSPHHSIFGVILCFKWACRNTARRNKSLHVISFERFKKKIKRNARRGAYDHLKRDSIPPPKPVVKPPEEKVPKVAPATIEEVVTQAPVLEADSLIILNEFLFEINSATLKGDQFSSLDSIMDFLIDHPSLSVRISGHTDDTGNENHNRRLSTRRAEVVAEYLIGNGVAGDRITFQGLGSSRPLAPNDTPEGRSKNRRVELLIHDRRQ